MLSFPSYCTAGSFRKKSLKYRSSTNRTEVVSESIVVNSVRLWHSLRSHIRSSSSLPSFGHLSRVPLLWDGVEHIYLLSIVGVLAPPLITLIAESSDNYVFWVYFHFSLLILLMCHIYINHFV